MDFDVIDFALGTALALPSIHFVDGSSIESAHDTDHALCPRFSTELVATALKDTSVVMVTGQRQCGKTTLVRDLVRGKREFITMDDDTVLAAARRVPTGGRRLRISMRPAKLSETWRLRPIRINVTSVSDYGLV